MMMYIAFFALVLLSAFFSGSETSLFSIDKVTRNRLNQSKQRMDRVLARMLSSPRKLLITILLGNEVTNVALSVVEPPLRKKHCPIYQLQSRHWSQPSLLSPLLIVGEITPKTWQLTNPSPWLKPNRSLVTVCLYGPTTGSASKGILGSLVRFQPK